MTRARCRWGAIANLHAKVFDFPSTPSAFLGHDPGNRMKILFNFFFLSFICENTHKVWYKIFEIDMVIIFDLLTSKKAWG